MTSGPAGMTEASASAGRFGKDVRRLRLQPADGLKHELSHALPAPDGQGDVRCIEQPHDDFSPVVGIDDADSLRHDKSPDGAESAA